MQKGLKPLKPWQTTVDPMTFAKKSDLCSKNNRKLAKFQRIIEFSKNFWKETQSKFFCGLLVHM